MHREHTRLSFSPTEYGLSRTIGGRFMQPKSSSEYRAALNPTIGIWTPRINQPLGAAIAPFLVRVGLSPNQVSLVGGALHLVGAALVVFGAALDALTPVAFAAALLWQLGFALDHSDGQIARVHSMASPLGAWIDQMMDFFRHAVVVGAALTSVVLIGPAFKIYLVPLAVFLTASNLFYLFASSQKGSLIGHSPAIPARSTSWFGRFAKALKNANDHGLYLALTAIAVPFPLFQIGVQTVYAMISLASVLGLAWALSRRW